MTDQPHIVIETIPGVRHRERTVGKPHPSHKAATDWLDRSVAGDARKLFRVEAVS